MIQGLSDARRARFAILGFASFQACVISLLYMGSNCSFSLGNLELERGELLFPLLFQMLLQFRMLLLLLKQVPVFLLQMSFRILLKPPLPLLLLQQLP